MSSSDEESSEFVAGQVRAIVAQFLGTIGLRFEAIPFLERIHRLAALIALWGIRINLTAAPTDPCELAFHIIDSLAPFICCYELLCREFGPHSRVLDLGSGAGFPGLVLASASPANFTLVENRRKRANFLTVAAAEMCLKNVLVEQRLLTQAQSSFAVSSEHVIELSPAPSSLADMRRPWRAGFDVVTARAFAPAAAFHSAAGPTLRRGGVAIFYANPGQDLARNEAANAALGDFRAVSYSIPRGRQMVQRVLGLWWGS
ncbi:MAG: class I SAM-dependent methyltransferase [Deltaproteobacteria bacterium]|nr:class I SAM-dependent methyltransferase [Deltaproteobacteria bacterium]